MTPPPSATDPRSADAPLRRIDSAPQCAAGTESASAASRIRQTAHDLRAPLTAIRESVRLVRDGELGVVGPDQRDCLSAAIDQCECVDQMIGELVELGDGPSDLSGAVRRWLPAAELQQAVEETLQPWARSRQIDVLWDGAEETDTLVFGDPQLLRRIVVNLAINSMRATGEGGAVLVRTASAGRDEAIRLSVIDQGTGISETELRRIARQHVAHTGGDGLGLRICHRLAALHFSPLRIRSRLGTGTEVSFDIPAGGPHALASRWSRWRVAQRRPGKRAPHHAATVAPHRGDAPSRGSRAARRLRLDPPSVQIEMAPQVLARPHCEDRLVAGTVILGAAMPRAAAEAFDRVLQRQQRDFELVYRLDDRRWAWLLDEDERTAPARLARITEAAEQEIESLRLTWSEPQTIPVDERRTTAKVSDLLVRESLAGPAVVPAEDRDQVRLGSVPLADSPAAAERLDRELEQLSSHWRRQSDRLREQTRAIRPVN